MEEVEAKDDQQLAANSGIPISESDPNPPSTCQSSATDPAEGVVSESESESPKNRTDIFRAVEVVERDSIAIAESFSTLFDSLRLVLSEVTSNSVDHMHCFSDAAGRLQESVLDAATKGNRYINSCLRLNQEMKGIDSLAAQLDSFHCEIHWCSWDGGSTQRPPYWEFKRKNLGLEQDLICSPKRLRFWARHYSVTVCQWAINQMR